MLIEVTLSSDLAFGIRIFAHSERIEEHPERNLHENALLIS